MVGLVAAPGGAVWGAAVAGEGSLNRRVAKSVAVNTVTAFIGLLFLDGVSAGNSGSHVTYFGVVRVLARSIPCIERPRAGRLTNGQK